jgi:acyl-CoA synthetase (AMP-forming)/AMP-acid ligase II
MKIFAWIKEKKASNEILFEAEPKTKKEAEEALKANLGLRKLPDSIIIEEEEE